MKRLKKLLLLGTAVLFLLTASGCDLTQTSVDAVMMPPRLSDDQEKIYQPLNLEKRQNISLIYPRSGDFRSAYVIHDLDQGTGEEALVFYRENTSAASPIKINVLDKDEESDEWYSVWVDSVIEQGEDDATPLVKATEVEKVSFAIFKNQTYIIIGFNIESATANQMQVRVYKYAEGKLMCLASQDCAEYEVYDLNGDGQDEIVLLSAALEDGKTQSVTAQLYNLEEDQLNLLSEVSLNSNVSEYTGLYRGKLESGEPALYVDYTYGSETFTDILIARNDVIQSLIQPRNEAVFSLTQRLSGLSCEDLTGSGVYYIPQNIPFLGYEGSSNYYVDWMKYEGEKLVLEKHTYVDYTFGYYLDLPEDWLSQVTMKKDSVNNEVLFYGYNGNPNDDSEKILKIRTFLSSELVNGELPAGYEWLSSNGQLVFGFQIYENNLNLKELNLDQVYQMFHYL